MSSSGVEKGEHCSRASAPAILIVLILLSSAFVVFSSSTHTDDLEETPASVLAGPNQNQTLILHMHYDNISENPPAQTLKDFMNTNGPFPASVADYDGDGNWGITLNRQAPKNIIDFIMIPNASRSLHIIGNVTLHYWASSPTDGWSMQLTYTLYDSTDQIPDYTPTDTVIGSNTTTKNMSSAWTMHNITIPVTNYVLQAGHTLILDFNRANIGGGSHPLYIDYDVAIMDSTLVMPTSSHFNISEYGSYGFDGIPRTEFGNQEMIWACANITDALGTYDIKSVNLTVKNSSSGSTVVYKALSASSKGPLINPYWEKYNNSFGPLIPGNYIANISAKDNCGNQYWSSWTIKIIKIDHFEVIVSTNKVAAGYPFSVSIEAKDTLDKRLKNWSGEILIQAIDNKTGLSISSLSNTSVTMSSSNQGLITIYENFTVAPKNITIKVINGTTYGQSQYLLVLAGPIYSLTVDPTSVTVPAGATTYLTANATDRFGNVNTSWQPYWHLGHPANATIIPDGMELQLIAILAGFTNLTCQDNASGKNFIVSVMVTSSGLKSIVVTPYSGTIWEGDSMSVTATGYDSYGNPYGIIGAVWSTDGFAMASVVGSGSTGFLFAGMAPETGLIKVTLGSVSGNASVSVICPPDGPTLGTFPNQVGYEDITWSVDLSVYWNDPGGTSGLTWFVTGVNDSLILIGHDAVSSSTINFIPQPNANGVDTVTFWVRDPTGYTNRKDITITVLPINDAPSFINDPPKELYVKFDLQYIFNYTYYVEDVDNPLSQLVLTAAPSADIAISRLSIAYDFPDENDGEPYFRLITLSVSDGSLFDSMTIKIWATSDTPPDLVTPLPDVTIQEGDVDVLMFDLDNYFTDVDGDMLFYSEGFEHVEIRIDTTSHEAFVSSPSEWSGQTNAVFVAHDPTGAIRIDTVVITVLAVNDPPAISPIPKVFVHYLVDYSLDLTLYVSDPDNDFNTLTIHTDDAINASYSSVPTPHLRLNYPANPSGGSYAGPYEVTVQLHVADAGGLFDDASFLVEVSDDYPPALTRTPPDIINFMEDEYLGKPHSLDLNVMFSDPDADDVLTYNYSGNENVTVVIESDGWLNFSAAPDWYGTEYITFIATDPHGAWVSFRVRVDVISVNDPPVLAQIPDQDHYGGRQWSLDISEYITDVDDPLSNIEILIDQPAFIEAVGTTLYFEFPADTDTAMVILQVSDGKDNSNWVTFNVNIKQSLNEILPWPIIAIFLTIGIICYLIALRILPHKLQELFIIHNDGRLIHHSGETTEQETDEDVVSAMFTAVQDFIKDSFKEGGESLKKMEMGDRKIVIEKGKWIYAAMIYTGWPHKSVFKNLTSFVVDIEGSYGKDIEHWNGFMRSLPGIDAVSKEMLGKKYHAGDIEKIRMENQKLPNN